MSSDESSESSESISTDDEEEVAAAPEDSTKQFFNKLLQFSETGEWHDCTIRASSAISSTYKDFRCHKLILSLSSDMFKTMFSSNFKEAKMKPDEPIVLKNVEPEVFAFVIRYMYGQEKDFKDISFGAEVYKLAQELQMTSLIQELDTFFKGSKKASEVFAIFDLYLGLDGNQETLTSCKLLLERETAVALASEQWLNVSMEAVQEFVQMEHLFVKEVDLVKALIRWGKHQVEKDGDDPTDGQKLRCKIFPALKHIRFVGLTQDEFANLCLDELGAVLLAEEKYAVLMAMVTKKWNLLPREICTSEAANPRKKPYVVYYMELEHNYDNRKLNGTLTAYLGFTLNKTAELIGLQVDTESSRVYEAFTFELLNDTYKSVIGQGSSTDKITAGGEEFVRVNASCSLYAGTNYTLHITFPCSNLTGRLYFSSYSPRPDQQMSNELTVSVHSPKVFCDVEKLLFVPK